ncbi:MAG: heavy-metal-associated domain-containing protein [Methyloprofundus sp.]|nr:heavy-metal-associated domain-containing protein [Methyloprofundus sp.]
MMTDSVKLTVTGMKCGGCEKTVTDKLMAEEGVLKVVANHADDEVTVEFDGNEIEEDDVIELIEKLGFAVQD